MHGLGAEWHGRCDARAREDCWAAFFVGVWPLADGVEYIYAFFA